MGIRNTRPFLSLLSSYLPVRNVLVIVAFLDSGFAVSFSARFFSLK